VPGFPRAARRLLAAAVPLWALACSGLPAPAAAPVRAPAPPAGGVPTADLPPLERQVMVTLPKGGERQWDRVIADLANVYALRPIYKWTMESVGEPCIVFELPANRSVEEMVERLSSDRRVDIAQPVQLFRVLAEETPAAPYNDPYAHLQHGVETLHLAGAHRWATGKGVKVAVVDTGVDLAHPDLAGRVTRASNFVVAGDQAFTSDVHGTAVAGVIAADANNHQGIVGVAPDAELLALKACWQDPPTSRQAVCNSYTLAQAVDAAVKEKARVVNFSLAGPPDPLLARLLETAIDRGAVVVAAADEGEAEGFPASAPGVIAVRAADLEGQLRTPPGPGERLPALAAPGVDVLSTVPRGAYDFFTGSSLAAAEVSGVVALLLEKRPDLTAAEIAALLADSARPVGPDAGDAGDPGPAGRLVDACAALGRLLGEACSQH
jgi:Subtilase family